MTLARTGLAAALVLLGAGRASSSTCADVRRVFLDGGCCGANASLPVSAAAVCPPPPPASPSPPAVTCADVERAYVDGGCCDAEADDAAVSVGAVCGAPRRTLVWSDEFDGDAVDGAKWHAQTLLPDGQGWYNAERQHYTDRAENARVADGVLRLTARAEAYTDQGVTKQYTSARLNSKFAFTYGEVEVRARLPEGSMTWPAIWMLGRNIDEPGAYWQTQGFGTTPWPACGEIDIMEHWGHTPNVVQSATHTPSSFGNTVHKGGRSVPTATSDFHVYRLAWTAERLVFSVDGAEHFAYAPPVRDAATWPFDADQYLLLNVAVQGPIDPSFEAAAMVVDYVRVYQNV